MIEGKEEVVKQRMLAALEKYSQGLTITELAASAGVHRQTAAKYLLELIALGKVHRRVIGPVALHYMKRIQKIEKVVA